MRLITVLAVGGVTVVASQLICRLYLAAHNRSRMRQATSAAVPVILTKEQQVKQAAKRAALLKRLAALPAHLRLGVTLPGMRELLAELLSDAVEQINAKIPLDKKTGKPKFPKNKALNGYVHS